MTFPAVAGTNTSRTTTTNTTSHAATLPASVAAGDLLVCKLAIDGNPTVTPSPGWAKLGQASNGTVVTGAVAYKIADGLYDDLTWTSSATEQSSNASYRITDYGITEGAELWDDGAVTLHENASYDSGTDTYTLNRNAGTSDWMTGPTLTAGNLYRVRGYFGLGGTESGHAIDIRGPFGSILFQPTVAGAFDFFFLATSTAALDFDLPNIGFSAQYTGISVKQVTALVSGTSANGSSTNSNPPSHDAGGTARDILWLATRAGDSTVVATVAPASFTNLLTLAAAGTGGASVNSAQRQVNGTTLDPGTFTSASEQWVSWTLAVEPSTGPVPVEEDHDESSAAGDSLSDSIVAGQAVAESTGAGESLVTNVQVGESMGESAAAGDAYADVVIAAEALAESSAAGDDYADEVGAAPTIVEEDMQESSEAGDALQQNVIVGNPMEEASTPSDAAGNGVVVAEAASESAVAGDSLSDAVVVAEGLSEAVAADDAYADQHIAVEALSDESAAGDDYFDQTEGQPTTIEESFDESLTASDAYIDEVISPPSVFPGSGGSLFDRPRRRRREELPVDVQPASEAPRGLDPAWRQRVIEQTTPPRTAPAAPSAAPPATPRRPGLVLRIDPSIAAMRRAERDAQIAAHLRAIYEEQQLEMDDEAAVTSAVSLLEDDYA